MNIQHQQTKLEHESESLMEPMIFSERSKYRDALIEMVSELRKQSLEFQECIPEGLRTPLVDYIRVMNSYYSNLIEGYKTHPREIEIALRESKDIQDEKNFDKSIAVAHVKLQTWIDRGNLIGNAPTIENLKKLHRVFYENIPVQAREVKYPNSEKSEMVIPGEFRKCLVEVHRHVPIHPESIFAFMQRFEKVYSKMSPTESLLSIAVAHHRFLWIHPFLDGNGRVARLMSQKMLQDSLNIDSIWSLSRGLARQKQKYMMHLMECDLKRRNDLDGVGHLSEEAVFKFTQFLFDVCIDQIKFMKDCVTPKLIAKRVLNWCTEKQNEKIFPNGTYSVLIFLITLGKLTRPEIILHTGIPERSARRITSTLEKEGVISSAHKQAPFRIHITDDIAQNWFPKLSPSID